MTSLSDRLKSVFVDEKKDALQKLFQRAYRANIDCYIPEIGHDQLVFGLMVHKSMRYFLVGLASTGNWVEILQYAPRFVFGIEGFTISAYRVGDSVEADIEESFPKNRTGAWMLASSNARQLRFDFMDGEVTPNDSNCSSLILAHIGNPIYGLCKLFIGVPLKYDESNRITEWGTTFTIWERTDFDEIPISNPSDNTPKAPEEVVAPPILTPKAPIEDSKKRKEKKENGQ